MLFLLLLYVDVGLPALRCDLLRIQLCCAFVHRFNVVSVCSPPYCVSYRDQDLLYLMYLQSPYNPHG